MMLWVDMTTFSFEPRLIFGAASGVVLSSFYRDRPLRMLA
jgi:hypothetical protein